MAIANWKGRSRRYKDEPVVMRLNDVTSTVTSYAQQFLADPEKEISVNQSIQTTLGLHFGRYNFYLEVRAYLMKVAETKILSEELLEELYAAVKKTVKSKVNKKK